MRELLVTLDWRNNPAPVGLLRIAENRGRENYQFSYFPEWIAAKGFAIDPQLKPIASLPYNSTTLWGAFQDISPDRWGRLVQDRAKARFLTPADYLLDVSDYMRMGALRLSDINDPGTFLADHTKVPALKNLRELEAASQRMEQGLETPEDIELLLQPGSSLGGAHPKAAIEDQGKLYIAKFQSKKDTDRISSWEATLLNMAALAGLRTTKHRLLFQDSENPVLLVERFDRDDAGRVPYISAMTLMELQEGEGGGSYVDLADVIKRESSQPTIDQAELWQRMIFNAMVGNTDDHLRNHGFLRDSSSWRLAPAFDLNPVKFPYDRRTHALSFDGDISRPSLDLCIELAPYFNVDSRRIDDSLMKIGHALKHWEQVARSKGLSAEEIKRMRNAFCHEDTQRLIDMAKHN